MQRMNVWVDVNTLNCEELGVVLMERDLIIQSVCTVYGPS